MEELNKIDKESPYFHMELLKYFYNFIQFYKQKEPKKDKYLNFDFGSEGLYVIQFDDLITKAYQEAEALKQKHNKLPDVDDDGYKL